MCTAWAMTGSGCMCTAWAMTGSGCMCTAWAMTGSGCMCTSWAMTGSGGLYIPGSESLMRSPESLMRSPESLMKTPESLMRSPESLMRSPEVSAVKVSSAALSRLQLMVQRRHPDIYTTSHSDAFRSTKETDHVERPKLVVHVSINVKCVFIPTILHKKCFQHINSFSFA